MREEGYGILEISDWERFERWEMCREEARRSLGVFRGQAVDEAEQEAAKIMKDKETEELGSDTEMAEESALGLSGCFLNVSFLARTLTRPRSPL